MKHPSQMIFESLGTILVPGKTYHSPLPSLLAAWYCYTIDGGHSVLAVLEQDYAPGIDLLGKTVPIPVKSVLRNRWQAKKGFIVVEGLRYSPKLGLIIPSTDDEF